MCNYLMSVMIGSKYEENKNRLIEKIISEDISIVIKEENALNNRCYFCHQKIPVGQIMGVITEYSFNRGYDSESTYFIDSKCIEEITKRE